MTPTEEYAMHLVQRVMAEREEARKAPLVASLRDINAIANTEISEALESLVEQGKLHRSENLNKMPMYIPKAKEA